MSFRWILFEPFVIPSGSMEQTLLVQDYVVVKKWAYGVRIPFTKSWLGGPTIPERGDIVVFKSKDGSGHFLVKRVIGLPGESVSMDQSGVLSINGNPFLYQTLPADDNDAFAPRVENNGSRSYRVQYYDEGDQTPFEVDVPEGHLFMMGDNRNQSADSRFWGPLPLSHLMGKLVMIWMSCNESDSYSSFLCPPKDFRWPRIFKRVD